MRKAGEALEGVYQEVAHPRGRHDLGEYYRPDWLCECSGEEQ